MNSILALFFTLRLHYQRLLRRIFYELVLNFGGSWEDHQHLVDFVYNNKWHILRHSMVDHVDLLYGRKWENHRVWVSIDSWLLKVNIKVIETIDKECWHSQKVIMFFPMFHLWKGSIEVWSKRKIVLGFIRHFLILLAYQLTLPSTLIGVQNMFHVSTF